MMARRPTLLFLYGPPAAGKTTWAKEFCNRHPEFTRISADEVRKRLYGSEDTYGDSWTIYQEILSEMRTLLIHKKNVIYDATNLRKSYRLDYLNCLTDIPCRKWIVLFSVEKEESIRRHLARGRNIPVENLLPLFEINEPPDYDEGWDMISSVEYLRTFEK